MEAASIRRSGLALAGPKFVKGLVHCVRLISIPAFGLLVGARIDEVLWESCLFGFRGPAYRILEKQNHAMTNARRLRNLTHLQPVLLFKDSSDFGAPAWKSIPRYRRQLRR